MTEAPSLAASLDKFAAALTLSTKTSADLGEAVRASEQLRAKRTVMLTLSAVAVLLLIVLNLLLAISSRSTQQTIKDCTNPAGQCARESAARTGQVVGSIAQDNLTIDYVVNKCAIGDPTVAAFTACINGDLTAIKAGTFKSPQMP